MKCPRCQAQHREGVRFCEDCRAVLISSVHCRALVSGDDAAARDAHALLVGGVRFGTVSPTPTEEETPCPQVTRPTR